MSGCFSIINALIKSDMLYAFSRKGLCSVEQLKVNLIEMGILNIDKDDVMRFMVGNFIFVAKAEQEFEIGVMLEDEKLLYRSVEKDMFYAIFKRKIEEIKEDLLLVYWII